MATPMTWDGEHFFVLWGHCGDFGTQQRHHTAERHHTATAPNARTGMDGEHVPFCLRLWVFQH